MDRFLAPHTSEAIAHSQLTYVPSTPLPPPLTPPQRKLVLLGPRPPLVQRNSRRGMRIIPGVQPLPLWFRLIHRPSFPQRTRERLVRTLSLLPFDFR